ncbi:hypothetical protein B7760_03796 [Burkholderia glumae]|nr:hypothetical protein B7760_03796 [Burkholderia glumae]
MDDTRLAAHHASPIDDPLAGDPDTAERIILTAVRIWLHPDAACANPASARRPLPGATCWPRPASMPTAWTTST